MENKDIKEFKLRIVHIHPKYNRRDFDESWYSILTNLSGTDIKNLYERYERKGYEKFDEFFDFLKDIKPNDVFVNVKETSVEEEIILVD